MKISYEDLFAKYQNLQMEHQQLLQSLTISENYVGLVDEKVCLELEFWKRKAALATQIIRSLEFSVVYDWGDEFTPPKPSCCPFCGKHEVEGHNEHCDIFRYFSANLSITSEMDLK
jgi:hypothetical protein